MRYSTLVSEGSLDLHDKEWKRITETLCRIVVSCTRGCWWYEDEWEDLFYHIPRFSSEVDAFAMWVCVAFVHLLMKLPYNSRTWHLGESWNSCCQLQAGIWHGRSSPCFLWVKTYVLWDRCFLSYLSSKHIILVKIGAPICFVKVFSIESDPYFIWNTLRFITSHSIVLMTESPIWL